jgi:L-ascorbate metabolism protein UlaG (beta-lactamase superfamily)
MKVEGFTWYKQSAFGYAGDGLTVYIDPWGIPDDATEADAIFITHAHFDHYQKDDIAKVQGSDTHVVAPRDVADELSGNVNPVAPGDSVEVAGVRAQAVPAYNIIEGRDGHPKEKGWVGFVLTLGDQTIYHAGDTDHLPELSAIKARAAFVPIGGAGFTMDVAEAARLVREMNPQVAVPMHYGFVEGCAGPMALLEFRQACDPVEVQVFEPVNNFEFS